MTQRIQPAEPPYAAEVQASFDRLPRDWFPPFQLFTTLARDPRLYTAFVRGAVTYLPDSNLSLHQREVLLLRVTARAGCEYEWGMRVHYFSRDAGLSPDQIYASVHGPADDVCWSEEERLIVSLTDQLHEDCTIEETLWNKLAERFTPEAIMEMILLAGYYRTVGYLANGLKLPLEPDVGRPFPQKSGPAN